MTKNSWWITFGDNSTRVFTFMGPRKYLVVGNTLVNYTDVKIKTKNLLSFKEYKAQLQQRMNKTWYLTPRFYKKAGKIRQANMLTKIKSLKWCVLKTVCVKWDISAISWKKRIFPWEVVILQVYITCWFDCPRSSRMCGIWLLSGL